MVNCCVPMCKSKKGKVKSIRFHEFPASSVRYDWIKNISRKDPKTGKMWHPKDRSLVCSLHFNVDDYRVGKSKQLLHPNAVPTLFPGYPPGHKIVHSKKVITPIVSKEPVVQGNVPKSTGSESSPCLCSPTKTCPNSTTSICDSNLVTRSITVSVHNGLLDEVTKRTKENQTVDVMQSFAVDNALYSKGTQAMLANSVTLVAQKKLKCQLKRKEKRVAVLKAKLKAERLEVKRMQKEVTLHKQLQKLKFAAEEGNKSALFLLEQIDAFQAKQHKWSQNTVKMAILWRTKSTEGYEFPRQIGLLQLPSRTTIKRYITNSKCEVGQLNLVEYSITAECVGLLNDAAEN